MTAALDQANAHHAKEKETIHKIVESLPDTEKGKVRRLLKEKSRLQNQFARKLNEDQTKKLTSEVDLHHETMNDHFHDSSSLRHPLGQTHNLAHLKQTIQHHHAQQQQTLHHQQIQQPPHPSLTRWGLWEKQTWTLAPNLKQGINFWIIRLTKINLPFWREKSNYGQLGFGPVFSTKGKRLCLFSWSVCLSCPCSLGFLYIPLRLL